MDDVRAVMDAVGSERAALLGISEGGRDVRPVRGHLPGAHRRPDDVGGYARRLWAPDYPWAPRPKSEIDSSSTSSGTGAATCA